MHSNAKPPLREAEASGQADDLTTTQAQLCQFSIVYATIAAIKGEKRFYVSFFQSPNLY